MIAGFIGSTRSSNKRMQARKRGVGKMDTSSLFSLVDMVVVACGVYVIYLCLEMKTTGKIKQNMLMPKGLDVMRCKDVQGYIQAIAMKQLVLGVLAFGCGILGLLQDFGVGFVNSAIYLSFLLVFAVYVVWYTIYMKKVIRKFW